MRRTAGDALSDIGDPAAQPSMCQALKDSNKLVRWRAARFLFDVPFVGSLPVLLAAVFVFVLALVLLGYAISTFARTQMQAMQLTFFFFLPSILLSGFMFPFRGMPEWAQWIGEALPLTHFLRVLRGILLKGSGPAEIAPNIWPIGLFLLVAATIALRRYRETLD